MKCSFKLRGWETRLSCSLCKNPPLPIIVFVSFFLTPSRYTRTHLRTHQCTHTCTHSHTHTSINLYTHARTKEYINQSFNIRGTTHVGASELTLQSIRREEHDQIFQRAAANATGMIIFLPISQENVDVVVAGVDVVVVAVIVVIC